MDALTVTVTAADLDTAIDAVAGMQGIDQCRRCVMAQAIHRATGEPTQCGRSTATSGAVLYVLPSGVDGLIDLFDNHRYDELRQLLPVTFQMEACR